MLQYNPVIEETVAPPVDWTSQLPTNWGNLSGTEKVNYFNQNNITPDQLAPYATPEEIQYFYNNMGYTVGLPTAPAAPAVVTPSITTQQPEPVQAASVASAPAEFNPVGFDWTKGVQNINGTIYAPRFDYEYFRDENGNLVYDEAGQPARLMEGVGESAYYVQGPATQYVKYNEADKKPGAFYEVYDVAGNLLGYEPFVAEDFGRGGFFEDIFSQAKGTATELAPLAAFALTAGGAGGLLGSALSGGALSGTAASALGNALISGGAGALTGQDPLKAALLAGGLTYGGGLLSDLLSGAEAASGSTLTDAQFIAADAAQLAAQGISAPQIEQILQASGVNISTAVAAADAAISGMSVDQIAKDITLGNRGLFTDTATTATPTTVTTSPEGLQTVTTTAAAPVNAGGLLSSLAAAVPVAVTPQAPVVSAPLEPSAPADQVVEVTGTAPTQPEVTFEDILAALSGGVSAPTTPVAPAAPADQVIEVPGTAQQPQQPAVEDLAAAIASIVSPPAAPSAPADQVIDVTGTAQQKPATEDLAATIASAITSALPATTAPTAPAADQVIDVTGTAQQKPATDDLAAAIAATVNPAAVTTTAPVTPADQVIDVTGTAPKQQTIGDVAAAVNAGTLYGPGMTGTQTAVYDKVLEQTGSKTAADTAATAVGLLGSLSIADIIKVLSTMSSLGMLGGGGGGGGTATSRVPTSSVPVNNDDYYKAIQQYYNTYMPQTPRDVATPLKQWYESKFGG